MPRCADRRLKLGAVRCENDGGRLYNVNKVATAVQLRLDVFALGLSPEVYARLKMLAGSRMTARGEIVLAARRFRTQEANRADARDRLAELLVEAHTLPLRRAKLKTGVGCGRAADR